MLCPHASWRWALGRPGAAVSGALFSSRWSRPGFGARAPWSLPAARSRCLTHELTLAGRLPRGVWPGLPTALGGRRGPGSPVCFPVLFLSSVHLSSVFTLWVKMSHPQHTESVRAKGSSVCPPRSAGSADFVAARPAQSCMGGGAHRAAAGVHHPVPQRTHDGQLFCHVGRAGPRRAGDRRVPT